MTAVPDNWMFPLHTERILSLKKEEQERYFRELIFDLQRMYEILANGINGDIRSYSLEPSRQWVPTLNGSTGGTFTYDHQTGWVWRQGIFVELWFDVQWTATTASNNLYLELPYEVATTDDIPFVGVVQPSGITYTGGTEMVVNAITDTYRGEFWNCGSGFTSANQAVVASGRLIGHLRYIGKTNE